MDDDFANEVLSRSASWRRVVTLAVQHGVSVPGMSTSLAYFDAYKRKQMPANLVQAQRDFFGSHTYKRTDMDASKDFHTVWDPTFGSFDSITTTGYNQ